MSETLELNEEAVEAAAKTLFETDEEMMGALAALFPENLTSWDTVPEDFREAYRTQVRKVVGKYFEVAG